MIKKSAFALAIALFMAACAPVGIPITYNCTGTTETIQVTYNISTEEQTTETVTLPWEETVNVDGETMELTLLALNPVEEGEVECNVSVDGRTVSTADAPGGIEIIVDYQDLGNTTRISSSKRGFSAESGPILVEGGEEIRPTNTPQPMGSMAFENGTQALDVCEIYVAPDEQGIGWGNNRIDGTLGPGDVTNVRELRYGEYKVKVVGCDGVIIAVSREFAVQSALQPITIDNPVSNQPSAVTNDSSSALCSVSISPDGDNFSPDLLNDNQRLERGEDVQVLLTPGQWFMQARTCDGDLAVLENLTLQQGIGYAWTITDATLTEGGLDINEGAVNVRVFNQTSENMCALRYVSTGGTEWAENALSVPIGRGDEWLLIGVPRGTVDFKAEDCRGNLLDWQYRVDLNDTAETETELVIDGTLNATAINNSGQEICELNVRPAGAAGWLRDFLSPSQRLVPSQELRLYMPPGDYDLRATTCENEVLVTEGVTVEGAYTWDITQ